MTSSIYDIANAVKETDEDFTGANPTGVGTSIAVYTSLVVCSIVISHNVWNVLELGLLARVTLTIAAILLTMNFINDRRRIWLVKGRRKRKRTKISTTVKR